MTAADLKSELKILIDNESDPKILKAINVLLKKASSKHELKDKLTSRALKAESDIKEGKFYERTEVKRRLQTNSEN